MGWPWPLRRRGGGGDGYSKEGDVMQQHDSTLAGSSNSNSSRANDTVTTIHNIADTEQARRALSGEETTFGGEKYGIPTSLRDRQRQMEKAMQKGDPRLTMADVDDMQPLLERFHDEFARADAALRQRTPPQRTLPLLQRSDKETLRSGDKLYEQWRADQAHVREQLQLHWLDMFIDRPFTSLVYMTRAFTTVGLCYGVGRTVYLFRTMDKVYAKMNGVSIVSLAVHEISYPVLQGALAAVAGLFGLRLGDALASALATLSSDDVKQPQRTWYNITASSASVGLCAGGTLALLHRKVLTTWGKCFIMASTTAVGTIVGLYLGCAVYLPYARTRTRNLYDPYWRPWYTRNLHESGASNVRGRYV